jgi:hypothetical protein
MMNETEDRRDRERERKFAAKKIEQGSDENQKQNKKRD